MSEEIKDNEVIIEELEFPHTIIDNIGMYLGSTNNFHTPLREIINNSTDELLNGHGTHLHVYYDDKNKVVVDNGRGLPFYIDPKRSEKVITESILTVTHTGSKFHNEGEKTGGLHGVGSTAVNAVSKFYSVYVNASKKDPNTTLPYLRDKILDYTEKGLNPVFKIKYEEGYVKQVDIISYDEMISEIPSKVVMVEDFSTLVYFSPNLDYYSSGKSPVHRLPLKLVRVENPNSIINVNGTEIGVFDYKEDVLDNDSMFMDKFFNINVDVPELETSMRLYFSYNPDKFDYVHHSTTNLIENPWGGFLEDVAWRSIGNALKKYNVNLKQSDCKFGLRLFACSFTSLKMQFQGQLKEKLQKLSKKNDAKQKAIDKSLLINPISEAIYKEVVNVPENSDYFDSIINRILEYKRQMDKLTKKDFVMSHIKYSDSDPTKALGVGSKVYECTSKVIEDRELFLVEGKSAAGPLLKTRDIKIHAILPLKGVPLNATKVDIEEIVENKEYRSLVNTIGTGLHPFVKMDRKRYGKLMILSDADAAGGFIRSILLGFIGMYLLEWVKEGRVFVVEAPSHIQEGKFIYDGEGLNKRKKFTRFKGLGEMNHDQAGKIAFTERKLTLVTPEDVEKAISIVRNSKDKRQISVDAGLLVDFEDFGNQVDDRIYASGAFDVATEDEMLNDLDGDNDE